MLIPIHKFLGNKIEGIIHVGAHTAEELDYYVSNGYTKVIWVEANPAHWTLIEEKIKQHKDMKLGRFAASSTTGEKATLKLNGISSSILKMGSHKEKYPNSEGTETVEVDLVSTDDWIEANIIERRDFNMLNIDVQGYELEALKGMTNQLKHIDIIYTEVNYEHLYKDGALINEIDDFLTTYDFKRVATESVKNMGWGEGLYVRGKYLQAETKRKFLTYKLNTLPKNPLKILSLLSKRLHLK